MLCGDNEKKKILTLLKIEDPYRTKLTYEWDDLNLLKSDNKIRFKFDLTTTNNKFNVYKINYM